MKKPKVTIKTVKKELADLQVKFDSYRQKARSYILELGNVSNRRALMTIEPANKAGMINGLTIPELVMLVNLNLNTGEETVLRAVDDSKNLQIVAKKNSPRVPWELL